MLNLNPAQLRAETAQRLWRVLDSEKSESLDAVLGPALESAEQQAWMSAALYGSLRFYPRYKNQLYAYLSKPIKPNEGVVEALIILGMHQLSSMRIKSHAAINETVNACKVLEKTWAVKLVNGILRNYQRELLSQENEPKNYPSEIQEFAHPKWIIKAIKKDWPQDWRAILEANNQQASMTLRVNESQMSRDNALLELENAKVLAIPHPVVSSAVVLQKARDVSDIPQFGTGLFSVQDAAAQLAAQLLIADQDKNTSLNVLDACAAPGGKTCHLLERLSQDSSLTALDVSESRLKLLRESLQRLGFSERKNVVIKVADAADLSAWHDTGDGKHAQTFDRILLDAPCTASGVIRRHPDIKIRRDRQQVLDVVDVQANLLDTLWSTLKVGGRMLYATCSIFKAENFEQVQSFLSTHNDAEVIPLSIEQATNTEFGSQIFPGSYQRDGFFYALLEKRVNKEDPC